MVCVNIQIVSWNSTTAFDYYICCLYLLDLYHMSNLVGYIAGEPDDGAVPSLQNLLITQDGGATWTDLRPRLALYDISLNYIDDIEGLTAVGSSVWINSYNISQSKTGVIFSNDYGQTWRWSFPGNDDNIASVSMYDANNGFAIGDNYNMLYHTSDGGVTWNSGVSISEDSETVLATSPTSAVVVCAGSETIQYTTDSAVSINTSTLNAVTIQFKDVAIGANGIGYAVGESSYIFKTTDYGVSWYVTVTVDVSCNNFHGVSMIPGTNDAIIVGDNYLNADETNPDAVGVYKINNDDTFVKLPGALRGLGVESLQSVKCLSVTNFWAVGQETNSWTDDTSSSDYAVVIKTTDGGQTWRRVTMPNGAGQQTTLNRVVFTNTISNICFPAGTPITCDQGIFAINKIDTSKHTIRGNKIVAITETVSADKYLVCFDAGSLGENIPTRRTAMTPEHKVFYKGTLWSAWKFLRGFQGVHKVNYDGNVLYNVLMQNHTYVVVNNMFCETLDPSNEIAKSYMGRVKSKKNDRNLSMKLRVKR